jgi:hypothetical protein
MVVMHEAFLFAADPAWAAGLAGCAAVVCEVEEAIDSFGLGSMRR